MTGAATLECQSENIPFVLQWQVFHAMEENRDFVTVPEQIPVSTVTEVATLECQSEHTL